MTYLRGVRGTCYYIFGKFTAKEEFFLQPNLLEILSKTIFLNFSFTFKNSSSLYESL
jgi:hypothetical protein